MKMKAKNIALQSLLAVSFFSLGYLGAVTTDPAFALDPISPQMTAGDPQLREALKNHFINKFFNLIDATESQKKELNSLFDEQCQFATPIREKMRSRGLKIADMIADDSVSDQALLTEADELKAMREEIAARRRNTMIKVRSILTKEQKELIANRIKARLTGNPRLGLGLDR